MPDPRSGGIRAGHRACGATCGPDPDRGGECGLGRGAAGPDRLAGPADGGLSEPEAGQPGDRLVRDGPEGRALQDPTGGGAARQADGADGLVGGRSGPCERASGERGWRGSGLWRDAFGRRRAAGGSGAEGAGAGGNAVSVRLHGHTAGQWPERSFWRGGAGGLSLARPDCGGRTGDGGGRCRGGVRRGRRMGPAATSAPLCGAGGGDGGRWPADWVGDAGADDQSGRGGRLSGCIGIPWRAGRVSGHCRAGGGPVLCGGLVGICGASAGRWLRRCDVSPRSAVGRSGARLCRHRLVPAAGGLARGRRRAGCSDA